MLAHQQRRSREYAYEINATEMMKESGKKTGGIFFFFGYEGKEKIKIRLFHVESEEEYISQLDV